MRSVYNIAIAVLLLVPISWKAQQLQNTGTKEDLPLKTAVIKDAGTEDVASYLSGAGIVRFWVFKAGSTTDVEKIISAFRKAKGVKEVKEGDVNGDYKEFVLELDQPREPGWYKKTFKGAGITHLKFNEGPARAISEL